MLAAWGPFILAMTAWLLADIPWTSGSVELRTVLPQADYDPLLAVLQDKLAYCSIAKVASTQFKQVVRRFAGYENWSVRPHDTSIVTAGTGLELMGSWQEGKLLDAFNDPSWVFFALLREPTERFLSGYLQKCHTHHHVFGGFEYNNCPYRDIWPHMFRLGGNHSMEDDQKAEAHLLYRLENDSQALFAEAVETWATMLSKDPCERNRHWRPQYCNCGLEKLRDRFVLINFKNMLNETVEMVQDMAYLTQDRREQLQNILVERLAVNHDKPSQQTNASDAFDYYYANESVRDTVREIYAKDYHLFEHVWATT